MTREEAKKLAPIIKAFGDGEDVQSLTHFPIPDKYDWITAPGNPSFDPRKQWRIKPKPVECFVIVHSDGSLGSCTWASRSEAALVADMGTMRVAHMREVED